MSGVEVSGVYTPDAHHSLQSPALAGCDGDGVSQSSVAHKTCVRQLASLLCLFVFEPHIIRCGLHHHEQRTVHDLCVSVASNELRALEQIEGLRCVGINPLSFLVALDTPPSHRGSSLCTCALPVPDTPR